MNNDGFLLILLVICCVILGLCWGYDAGVDEIRVEAIEHGYAEYHRTTGNWQWRENNEQ